METAQEQSTKTGDKIKFPNGSQTKKNTNWRNMIKE